MNKAFITTALIAIMAFATATESAAQKRQPRKQDVQPEQHEVQQSSQPQTVARQLTNGSDSLHYVIGAYLGRYVNTQGFSITNPNMFLLGLDDALSNNQLLINSDTINLLMNGYIAAASANNNMNIEKELFAGLKELEGVGSLPTGVYYLIAQAGEGKRPLATDTVTMNVRGYLPNGDVFEDSYAKNSPLITTPQNLIPGMKDILQIMPAGSTWRVFIPAAQAYGQRGVQGVIPAYSAVIFDIELLDK